MKLRSRASSSAVKNFFSNLGYTGRDNHLVCIRNPNDNGEKHRFKVLSRSLNFNVHEYLSILLGSCGDNSSFLELYWRHSLRKKTFGFVSKRLQMKSNLCCIIFVTLFLLILTKNQCLFKKMLPPLQ